MKIAFLFPGQGSQKAGMGLDFYEQYPEVQRIFETADRELGFSLSTLCFQGPQEELNKTANTQPALLTVSAAIATIVQNELNLKCDFTAGHSLGEYTALWFAQSISFATAIRLVRHRGESMQTATPNGIGAMAAIIGLDSDLIDAVCAEAAQDQVLQPANFNSPGQIVISGHTEAVQRGIEIAKSKGAKKGVLLPVSAPFHCALMHPAALAMTKIIENSEFTPPTIPVINNADAMILDSEPSAVRNSLIRQITAPVKWEQTVNLLVQQGVDTFIEIGPGKVLTNLVKRIAKGCALFSVEDILSLNKLKESLS